MSAFFLRKKIFRSLGKIFTFLFIANVLFYAWFLSGAQCVESSKNFYFLVFESTHVEVSTYQTQALGGAGFLLKNENCDYIALSVYLKGEEGDFVQNANSQKTPNCKIVEINSGNLYFKRISEKKNAKKYVGAFDSFYGLIQALNEEIYRLDKGATQESSKRILTVLKRQFAYLNEAYKETFPAFSSVCENAFKNLSEIVGGIVYTKDLRYLMCSFCASYVDLSAMFSL